MIVNEKSLLELPICRLIPHLWEYIQKSIGIGFNNWREVSISTVIVRFHQIHPALEESLSIRISNFLWHIFPHLIASLIYDFVIKQFGTSQIVSRLNHKYLKKVKMEIIGCNFLRKAINYLSAFVSSFKKAPLFFPKFNFSFERNSSILIDSW